MHSPMSLDAILFDKDGTLIDFDATWGPAAYEVMRILSGGDAAVFATLVRISEYVEPERRFRPTSPLIAGSSATYGPLWAEALGRPAGPELYREMDELFGTHSLKSLAPIAEPQAVLGVLRRMGLVLGIATNDSEGAARAQAEALGLTDHLAYVAGYDSGHGSKPGPGMVLGFARACGIDPRRVALVGDSLHDLHCARAAGAVAVAVLSGPLREAARADLEPHADHVIASIAALPALVERLRAGAEAGPAPKA
jgi:phosphoglycolate phosphatase